MFDKIQIERFRGIRYADIEGFRRINLFFGKNNCGKSTLLESLFLASGLSNPSLPVNVNLMRGYGKVRLNDFELDFYNLDATEPIHIRMTGDEVRDLRISLYEQPRDSITIDESSPNVLSNVEDGLYGLKFNFSVNGRDFKSELQFAAANPAKTARITSQDYTESLRCIYLSPKYDFNASIQGLKNILQNKDEPFIIEGLRIIEQNVRDFTFTDNEMLVDIGLDKRIPVNMLGDGARKIVSLMTAIYDCKDGTLLIDELSNGFHYSVMRDLWKVLIDASVRNNTQLFVTTHDIDSIKGLRDAAVGNSEELVAAFKLLKGKDGLLKTYRYSIGGLDYAINQEIEIR